MLFNESMSIGEKFINSLGITILGMVIVFVVLIILAYSLNVLKLIFGDKPKKVEENIVIEKETIVEAVENEEDLALVVLITAAIAAASDIPQENIIVRSIKELPQKKSEWAMAGRQQQMLNRI